MTSLSLSSRMLPVQHCSVVQNLRIRDVPLEAETLQALASRKIRRPHKSRISLYIGEVAASQRPVVLDTLLGSCVAVCLYDPFLRAGGMNHILLPNCRAGERSARCGVHAMELLINELMKLGGDRRRFVAKAFGGANVIPGIKMPPIGGGNAKFVREFLALEKIPLIAERLGGIHAVHVFFRTDSGKATVHTVDGSRLPKVIDAENRYWKSPSSDKSFGGEITLF
jgi:chemotaxis receptor (MCP) glutamine deamidase CheD